MSPPLPEFLADPQKLGLLPGKIEIAVPAGLEKIAHPLLVRAVKLVSANYNCAPHYFSPKPLTKSCLATASY